eukprot:CAMPEP_0195283556 /NCGR_PEP_ID=MMETSP0707-20130614/2062_1 /TAXON_ID=33640 /ORGANISM="Asterionellopsis glacialis, Strain CCMP134" /LENGTH=844 /DNA_ID=CAMNT_0040342741 /DNA_START=20 /DNA_END=2554 /DNA_ORIENTATION=-
MNGGYGGNFDMDPFGGGNSGGGYYDHQQQDNANSSSSQQRYQQQVPIHHPCYERYDPAVGQPPNPTPPPAGGGPQMIGEHYSSYNSTPHHTMLQPAPPATTTVAAPTTTTTAAYQPPTAQHHRLRSNRQAHHHHSQQQNVQGASYEISFEPDPIANSVEMRHQVAPPTTTQTGGWPVSGGDSDSNFFQDALDDLALSIAPPLQPQQGRKASSPHQQVQTQPSRKQQQPQPKKRAGRKPRASASKKRKPAAPPTPRKNPDIWLESISLEVSGVSLEPMKGTEVVNKIRLATDDVVTRYLPCVDFLVACQQELRAGLAAATRKRVVRGAYRDSLTPRQFYNQYLQPLPDRFICKNQSLMGQTHLRPAVQEIQKLCGDARKVEYQGCEAMKNAFLGGMKEGVSWGLRKWLSKNGGALTICNDLECILTSVQKMDRGQENTKKLGEVLRPMAKQAFDRLKKDVPASYQEQSTAHPYLPFFHRLECALRGISNFDPDDDDVICIDDEDEIEEVKSSAAIKKEVAAAENKRKADDNSNQGTTSKRPKINGEIEIFDFDSGGNQEQVATAPKDTVANEDTTKIELKCARCTMTNPAGSSRCCMCDQDFSSSENYEILEIDGSDHFNIADVTFDDASTALGGTGNDEWEPPRNSNSQSEVSTNIHESGSDMAQRLESLAYMFDSNKQDQVRPNHIESAFWNERQHYASALRLFAKILHQRESCIFLQPVHKDLVIAGELNEYNKVVRNPLCFFDIAKALRGDGLLSPKNLSSWNMWRGIDLLEAIDLVFLNSLAYHGKEKTKQRSDTNFLRKILWQGIDSTLTEMFNPTEEKKRRECTPTRRGDKSGFVIFK